MDIRCKLFGIWASDAILYEIWTSDAILYEIWTPDAILFEIWTSTFKGPKPIYLRKEES